MMIMIDRGAFAGMRAIGLRDGALCEMSPQHRPHLVGEAALFKLFSKCFACASFAACGRHVRSPRKQEAYAGGLVKPVAVVAETTLNGDLCCDRPVHGAGRTPEYRLVNLDGQVIRQLWSAGPGGDLK